MPRLISASFPSQIFHESILFYPATRQYPSKLSYIERRSDSIPCSRHLEFSVLSTELRDGRFNVQLPDKPVLTDHFRYE
ncbi:hypothetical protein FJT64_016735 [Amphibalanus amphitrite]|uniref:Uncharacterized protein n=1 Tax=Amphibalanus amphitrite TaxID=1232801 RepID=A0A6A4XDH9_AMPAM|nr:hypothetical protein FJT64_016735 [Amphibalanus amphitrite]